MMFDERRILFGCCLILGTIDVRCSADDLSIVTSLNAVTQHPEIVAFYRSFNEQRLSSTRPAEPRSQIVKKEICEAIFSSRFFDMRGQMWIDTDRREIREELRNSYPQIFESIFSTTPTVLGDSYAYANPYRRFSVGSRTNTEGAVEPEYEYVFVCPVREQSTNEIKEYYVTRAYNMNSVLDAPPIAGRFVFAAERRNHQDGRRTVEMSLLAVADDSATTFDILQTVHLCEAFYLVVRRRNPPTPVAAMDPICSLSDADKVRLCASIFAAREFKYEVVFTPLVDNVQLFCEKKTVLIQGRVGWLTRWFLNEDGNHKEWTMGCTAFDRGNGEEVTYHVSRGKDVNSVFVYTSFNRGSLTVYNLAFNVSVANIRVRNGEQDGRFLTNDVED